MKPLAILLTIAITLTACSKKTDTAQPMTPDAAPGATQNTAVQQMPPGHPAIPTQTAAQTGTQPMQAVAPSPAPAATLTGKVLETMDSGGYTYVKLKTGTGDVWAAVNQLKVKVGSDLTIVPSMVMNDFESKTLNRKFDKIIFATVGNGAPMMQGGKPMGMNNKAPGGTNPAIDVSNISVSKAEGADAKTVAELWAGKASLKDKPVIVRGKVVKYLSGIMGKNWIHLRDGSGSDAGGNNDLMITTSDVATVGDVVIVRGTIHTNVDFGAGYAYAVIIEDARVSK